MTNSLFQGNDSDKIDIDPNKNYLEDLVGDNKKFKTPEELARGKAESDSYIEVMKKRMDEMRIDYLELKKDADARLRLEQLIDQFDKKQQNLTSSALPTANDQDKTGLEAKDIESLVSNKLREHEENKKYTDNFNAVSKKLREKFGSNYPEILKDRIAELGLDEVFVNDLARKHPTVLFKTLGLDDVTQDNKFQAPPRSERRSDNFSPTAGSKRTWAFYQNMKKTNPTLYWDPKTTVQMHSDAQSLGDEFEDGDFRAL